MMAPPESLATGAARAAASAGNDGEDDDVVLAAMKVNLRCALSGMRVRTPAHFSDVATFCVFDLDFFLEHAKRTRKWQCPQTCALAPAHALCCLCAPACGH